MTRTIRTGRYRSSTAAPTLAVGFRPVFSSRRRTPHETGSRTFGETEWRRGEGGERRGGARQACRRTVRSRSSARRRASWDTRRRPMPSPRWRSSPGRSTSAGSAPTSVRTANAGTRPRSYGATSGPAELQRQALAPDPSTLSPRASILRGRRLRGAVDGRASQGRAGARRAPRSRLRELGSVVSLASQ